MGNISVVAIVIAIASKLSNPSALTIAGVANNDPVAPTPKIAKVSSFEAPTSQQTKAKIHINNTECTSP